MKANTSISMPSQVKSRREGKERKGSLSIAMSLSKLESTILESKVNQKIELELDRKSKSWLNQLQLVSHQVEDARSWMNRRT